MKSITKTFNEHDIRVIVDSNKKEWFCASDVGIVLGLSDVQRQTRRLPEKGRTISPTKTKGGIQHLIYIDEPNLYRLVFKSRKEEAELFQDWVFDEVLPSIRKTGKYSIPNNLKKLSTENRKVLTDTWQECGIEKKHHFIQLTLQEYKALGIGKGKRKKDMSKQELLLLSAMESMEALKLFNDPKDNYYECRDSLYETAKILPRKELLK